MKTKHVCHVCGKRLPPLAIAAQDPYCSRVCAEVALLGAAPPARAPAPSKGRSSHWQQAQAVFRSLGFVAKLGVTEEFADIVCGTCRGQWSGTVEDLLEFAANHRGGCHGTPIDTRRKKRQPAITL